MTYEEKQGFKTFGSSTLTIADTGNSARIYVNQADFESFKELIRRGANNWPDSPKSVNQLYDIFIHGKSDAAQNR